MFVFEVTSTSCVQASGCLLESWSQVHSGAVVPKVSVGTPNWPDREFRTGLFSHRQKPPAATLCIRRSAVLCPALKSGIFRSTGGRVAAQRLEVYPRFHSFVGIPLFFPPAFFETLKNRLLLPRLTMNEPVLLPSESLYLLVC